MDTEKLMAHARERFDHEATRRQLREKYQAKMILGYRGGLFRASPENIALLHIYQEQEIVMLDLYENPVRVSAAELKHHMQQCWQEQMNGWLAEYEQANQRR
jgi:hypothetical protein